MPERVSGKIRVENLDGGTEVSRTYGPLPLEAVSGRHRLRQVAAGRDVVTVQPALGHAKATTTLGAYAHLWPSAEDRTRQAAEGLLVEVLTGSADHGRALSL